MSEFFTPENAIALLTLTGLEIVLGIDNIVFISILTQRLPREQQQTARTLGLWLAMFMRIGLVLAIGWVVGLVEPLFVVLGREVSGRDLILIGGGLFLVAKATYEIHDKLEGAEHPDGAAAATATFVNTVTQIVLLDAVFSLDSVITAVGMVEEIAIMIAAVVVAVGVMILASGAISRFIERRPTMKILALSFLILIGVVLVVEGFGGHVAKGYIYFAMGFSLSVELINQRIRKHGPPPSPVHLRGTGARALPLDG